MLKRTNHNGFPIVDVGRQHRCTFFAGLILRRQLLVLLRQRVWELQRKGEWMSYEDKNTFADSAFAKHHKVRDMQLSAEDRDALIDLRPFMDPSPYMVNDVMPLRRVYRLFNDIGVRHLTVVDCREQVVGMITRKDILPHNIERTLFNEGTLSDAEKVQAQAAGQSNKPHTSPRSLVQGLAKSVNMVARVSRKPGNAHGPSGAGSAFTHSPSAAGSVSGASPGTAPDRDRRRQKTRREQAHVSVKCERGILSCASHASEWSRNSSPLARGSKKRGSPPRPTITQSLPSCSITSTDALATVGAEASAPGRLEGDRGEVDDGFLSECSVSSAHE